MTSLNAEILFTTCSSVPMRCGPHQFFVESLSNSEPFLGPFFLLTFGFLFSVQENQNPISLPWKLFGYFLLKGENESRWFIQLIIIQQPLHVEATHSSLCYTPGSYVS